MEHEWYGVMNWPLADGWECEFCHTKAMTWGIIHGHCRCDRCGVQYRMVRNEVRVTTPICLLKEEYRPAFRRIWAQSATPVDQVTEEQWDKAEEELEAMKR